MSVRVVVAPDSFGATLTAAQAATAIADGWSSVRGDDEVLVKPQSDGGPGFLDCLDGVGRLGAAMVTGPLGRPVRASWRVDGDTAYVECAQACGLHLVENPDPSTAWLGSTAGVGELIAAALAEDPLRRLVIGLGGSATTDGGVGLLDALGSLTAAAQRLADIDVVVATDVDNPLTGARGAAPVFAPQKGADRRTVGLLADRLVRIGAELDSFIGRAVSDEAGAGAAGGLGAALLALGGHRVSGADLVAQATGLPAALHGAAVVITGEGRLDSQTAGGKVAARVAAAAEPGTEVIALVGEDALGDRAGLAALRIDRVHSLIEHVGERSRALTQARSMLTALAAQVARDYSPDHRGNRE